MSSMSCTENATLRETKFRVGDVSSDRWFCISTKCPHFIKCELNQARRTNSSSTTKFNLITEDFAVDLIKRFWKVTQIINAGSRVYRLKRIFQIYSDTASVVEWLRLKTKLISRNKRKLENLLNCSITTIKVNLLFWLFWFMSFPCFNVPSIYHLWYKLFLKRVFLNNKHRKTVRVLMFSSTVQKSIVKVRTINIGLIILSLQNLLF